MRSNAIETYDLHYRAGKTFELRDLTLNVREGSIYGFLGPNGAGKTTTIKLLMGMLRAGGGRIKVLGLDVPAQLHRILAEVGYVPERPHLYPFLTVGEAVRYHAAFFGDFDAPYAEQLLGTFNLPRDRRLSGLSKGEMGKLHVLLVLAQRPRLLSGGSFQLRKVAFLAYLTAIGTAEQFGRLWRSAEPPREALAAAYGKSAGELLVGFAQRLYMPPVGEPNTEGRVVGAGLTWVLLMIALGAALSLWRTVTS